MRSRVPADQIQQREQEDPHNIDKVPVQAAQLHRRVVLAVKLSLRCPQYKPGEKTQAGHCEIEREENLGLLSRLFGEGVGRDLNLALLDLLRIPALLLALAFDLL